MDVCSKTIPTDIGPATLVSTQYFLEHILPPPHPDLDPEKVLENLRKYKRGSRRAITKAGRWWGFAEDPAKVRRPKTGFLSFPAIVDAITRCSELEGGNSSLKLLHNDSHIKNSRKHAADTLSDAYMVIPSADRTKVTWADVAVIGEYGKRFSNRKENHEPIVRFFLSLLYAESYSLGWDPTVRMVGSSSSKPQYDYTVESADGSISTFRTLELLFKTGHRAIEGKGTRVWKVVRVVNGVPVGKPVVLKDQWVQEEFEREGTTLHRIQQFDRSDGFQREFSTNFLTVVAHGDVVVRSQRHAPHCDRTRLHIRNARAFKLGISLPDAGFFGPRPYVPHWVVSKDNPYLSGCRVHYRIVFQECCTSLDLSTPLPVVLSVLAQVCAALKLLHQAGWVHRDISLGNMMVDESGHARLADLEYVKRMGDESIPDLRIGTSPFMSTEVASQIYCYSLASPPRKNLEVKDPDTQSKLSPRSEYYRFATKYHLPLPSSDAGDASTFDWEIEFGIAIAKQLELEEQPMIPRAPESPLKVLGLVFDKWRSQLAATFCAAEKQWKSIDSSTGAGLHEQLASILQKMAKLASLPHEDGHPSSATRSRKHKRKDLDDTRERTADAPVRPTKKARPAEAT
ncbi:hypothetical protein NM688_g5850 [Phlebia brevispora]|uniref:Uncharacterized protein n=1 Tax=Phlebia brevispora TaxID=194682 RepID=A0ACC1SNX0_9APHY|nr:hypothetical protein NM688_g5850 [Phlebia brevispora]